MRDLLLKFRASSWFLFVLTTFCVSWVGFHFLTDWFDPSFGGYNSFLSTEASLMISILLELQLRQDAQVKELLNEVRNLVKIGQDNEKLEFEMIEDALEDIQEDLKTKGPPEKI